MVFMIKLPPAVSMPSPPERNCKDDRISLVKSLHRPYGQSECPPDQRISSNHHVSDHTEPYQNQQPYDLHTPSKDYESCSASKPKMALVSVFIVCACLVVFVITLTSYGNQPSPDVDSLRINDILDDHSFASQEVYVKTSCGHIYGQEENGAFSFKGIPYAKPPIGQLRWRKPVPLWIEDSWCRKNKMHQATEFGSPCFQLNPYDKKFVGSEDCLFLNVWTPNLDPNISGKHVMVYIHGGFLQFGNGHQTGLSPSIYLAKKLDVVFVSFNFRLYSMGFMALDMLTDNVLTDSRGNYGLWDQLCALQWVKENIATFGGDPKKVTLFGPDAGAASILALMSSRKSQGLFRTAWLVGPTLVFNKMFPDVSIHNKANFLNRSSCNTPSCLRKMVAEDVLTAHLGKDDASFRIRDQNDLPIQGIFPEQLILVDGELIKKSPLEALKEKQAKILPILLGSAAQAVNFWPGPDDLSSWTWSQYKKYVTTSLDSFGLPVSKMALSIYNATAFQLMDPNSTAEFLYTTMVSDIRQYCPVNELASEIAQASRSPVFRYSLTATPSKAAKIFGYEAKYAFHLWDLIAFFDQMNEFINEPSLSDWKFRDQLHKTVLAFVKSGGQDVANTDWLKFPKNSAYFGQNITFTNITKSECKFWSKSGLGVYAWVS